MSTSEPLIVYTERKYPLDSKRGGHDRKTIHKVF